MSQFRQLGIIQMQGDSWQKWQSTFLSAIDQDVIRVTWMAGHSVDQIKSRLLIRRQWETQEGLINDPAIILYPTNEPQVLYQPVSLEFVEAGLATFKVQVKKLIRFNKWIATDLLYSVKIEVA